MPESRQTIKLFIASSSDLAPEREKMVVLLSEINKHFQHLYLEPVKWETDVESGSYNGRVQDKINPLLDASDIVVFLFYSRAGIFTLEEFERTRRQFKKAFYYFKAGFSTFEKEKIEQFTKVVELRNALEKENSGLFKDFSSLAELENLLRKDLGLYLPKHYPPPAGISEASSPLPAPNRNADELADLPITTGVGIPDQPYKSLTWFTSHDARIFFGRTSDIKELYRKLDNKYIRVVAFFGQSGAGKSSLLHAGILPRLPKIWMPVYKRRTQDGSVTEILNGSMKWLEREKPTHPLLILDQLEEMYTNPYPDSPDEAAQFPILLRALVDSYPSLRIVLGFRSDKWADIEDLLKEGGLSVLPHFLKVLDHKGIREATAGVIEQQDLVDRFRGLALAPGEGDLPVRIANDLMSRDDSRANAAPLLQFILRRMWDEVAADPAERPVFSWALYEKHRRASMLDLLDKQLEEMSPTFRKEVENGLTLDLLRGFVTEENTAGVVTEDTLLLNYAHRPPQLIKDLCVELGNKYLLTSFPGSSKKLHWRLAHDALAPAVLRRFTESDAPGQRAKRILESKKGEIGRRGAGVLFSEPDLEIIEKGKYGMPLMPDALRVAIWECEKHYADAHQRDEEQRRAIVDFRCEEAKRFILQLKYFDALIAASAAAPLDSGKSELPKLMMEIAFVQSESNKIDEALACLNYLRQLTGQNSLQDVVPQLETLKGIAFRNGAHQILEEIDDDYFKVLKHRYFPDMIPVEGGTFQMGAEKGKGKGHRVTVDNFQIARTPVTWWQYYLYCQATGREMPSSPGWGRIGNHPVVNVNWYDAVEYLKWLNSNEALNNAIIGDDDKTYAIDLKARGYRLPTEAEWEFAARGGNQSNGFVYAGSDNLDEVGWYNDNAESKAHPVGKKEHPNELGLHDMSGNVDEWCWDWYSDDYYKNSPEKNPAGPDSGSNRVFRGGSWTLDADDCRVADRYWGHPGQRDDDVGFRPARTVTF